VDQKQRLIKHNAQDPLGTNLEATYNPSLVHIISFGLLSILGIVGLFNSTPSSAQSFLKTQISQESNSQRINLLSADYGPEVPKAIGGSEDIWVNNRLALLSPQVGIMTGTDFPQGVEVDSSGVVSYIVQKGDTLSEIAEQFDVSVNTIKWENNIGRTLGVGKELAILPVTGIRHTIAKDDTFGGIAKRYGVEIKDITIYNNIDDTKLVIGEKIIVPNGIKKEVTATKTVQRSVSSSAALLLSSSNYYIRPTTGRTSSLFGPRNGSYHYGIDFAAPTGTPIVAAADGTVVRTSCGSGYGKCLKIQHDNGTQTLYAHTHQLFVGLGKHKVESGETRASIAVQYGIASKHVIGQISVGKIVTVGFPVKQGQKIAAVGSTGRSTGPHLHFEIIESNGRKRDTNFLR
jgi:murein DD-endopeptidase MepM/ murein hydrolase activator NlpD